MRGLAAKDARETTVEGACALCRTEGEGRQGRKNGEDEDFRLMDHFVRELIEAPDGSEPF